MGEKIYDVEVARLISEGRLAEQYKVISRRLDSVSKENRNLKRQIEDLEAIIADGKKPDVSVSENGVSDGCECGGYHLAKQKIEELEKEIERLNRVVESKRETHILLRQRCKGEAVEYFDRNMFGSLIISCPPITDVKKIAELEETLKNVCSENADLKKSIDVLSKRITELREVHGL